MTPGSGGTDDPWLSEADLAEAERVTSMLMQINRVIRSAALDLQRVDDDEGAHLVLRIKAGADPTEVLTELNFELAIHGVAGAVAVADSTGQEL